MNRPPILANEIRLAIQLPERISTVSTPEASMMEALNLDLFFLLFFASIEVEIMLVRSRRDDNRNGDDRTPHVLRQ